MEKEVLNKILQTVKSIDSIPPYSGLNPVDLERVTFARNMLMNIIFENGFEISYETRRLIKSTTKRKLLPEKKGDYEQK